MVGERTALELVQIKNTQLDTDIAGVLSNDKDLKGFLNLTVPFVELS